MPVLSHDRQSATQGSPLLLKGVHRSRLTFHEVPRSPLVPPLKEVVEFYLETHEIPVVPAEVRGVHGVPYGWWGERRRTGRRRGRPSGRWTSGGGGQGFLWRHTT